MMQISEQIFKIGIIPVIAIDDADKAVPLACALVKGDLPAAEVTFRTAAGEEAIRRIAAEVPEVLVGAGTVLNLEQCDRALAAGAKFIVSPGYNEALVAHCQEKGVLVLPGCVNASDMTRAANAGLEYVKFFPRRAVRRCQRHQGPGPRVPQAELHAHRRREHQEPDGLPGL